MNQNPNLNHSFVTDKDGPAVVKFVSEFDHTLIDRHSDMVNTFTATDRKETYVVAYFGPENPVQIIHHLVFDELAENGQRQVKGVYTRSLAHHKALQVMPREFRRLLDKRFNKRVEMRSGQKALALPIAN